MRITIGMGSCGIAAGADEIYALMKEGSPYPITVTGCNGGCHCEPIVTVDKKNYVNVDLKGAGEIIKLIKGEPNTADEYAIEEKPQSVEKRIALRNCGVIDPENIDEYIESGGYKPLTLTPEQIIEQVKLSGIGGRGGVPDLV